MVSIVFSHTLLVRRAIAAEALPILTSSSVSRLTLLEMVDPRQVKSGHVEGAFAYGDAGSRANVLSQNVSIFFILIVRPTCEQPWAKQLMSSRRAVLV